MLGKRDSDAGKLAVHGLVLVSEPWRYICLVLSLHQLLQEAAAGGRP